LAKKEFATQNYAQENSSFGASDADENDRLLKRIRANRKSLRAKRRVRRNDQDQSIEDDAAPHLTIEENACRDINK